MSRPKPPAASSSATKSVQPNLLFNSSARLPKERLFCNSPVVTVVVGPEKLEFIIHKDLICKNSKYFAKAFSGSFLESETNLVKLDDVSVVLFRIFSYWLYYDQFAYTASDNSNIEDDFRTLKQFDQYGEADEYEDDSQDSLREILGDDPITWPNDVLVKLWLFGDRFDAQKFRNDIISLLISMNNDPDIGLPSDALIRNVYDNTTKDSLLRKWIVDTFGYWARFRESMDVWQDFPFDFVVGVMVYLGTQRPLEQCDACSETALADNKIEDSVERKLPPYRIDICLYHDHADDEERDSCRAQRKKAA